MRSKKNGFTLIELLAVIVILAIIALIATPLVLNIIEDAKTSAFKASVQQMVKNAQTQFVLENIDGKQKSITFSNIPNEQNAIKLKTDTNYNYKIQIFSSSDDNIWGYFSIDDKKSLSAYGKIPLDEININKTFLSSEKVFFTEKGITIVGESNEENYTNICDSLTNKDYITYEDFLAVGDGKTNDGYAIYYAHECANKLEKDIIANTNTYYIDETPDLNKDGTLDTIIIETNVNWNNSNIIIENGTKIRGIVLFQIPNTNSLTDNDLLKNDIYNSNTTKVPEIIGYINSKELNNSYFYVGLISENDNFYRLGSTGETLKKSDYFKIDKNGDLLNKIRYGFDKETIIEIFEIPEKQLKLENVNFISVDSKVNSLEDLKTYRGYTQGIQINRSNVLINNLNHYLIDNDLPTTYMSGFLKIDKCSDVTITNSNFRAHKYAAYRNDNGTLILDYENGSKYGTYDISISNSSNITFDNIGYTCNEGESIQDCYYKNMIDTSYWGINGTNNNKNWTITNSTLNRIDSHFPSQDIYISSSIIGNHSVRVTGSGNLNITNSSFDNSEYLVLLREDFGSTWNGHINLNNIYLNSKKYSEGQTKHDPRILTYATNNFNFGYEIYIPSLTASNIFINEENLGRKSSGFELIRNTSKLTIENLSQEFKPMLVGNMSFNNIRSDNFDKLNITQVFTGNDEPKRYTAKLSNNIVSYFNKYGLDKSNINYYKNNTPIDITIDITPLSNSSFETYYKDQYTCTEWCTKEDGKGYCYNDINKCYLDTKTNAINISTTSLDHPYCEILVFETKQNDWYASDTINVKLSIYNENMIKDYGIGYSTNSYKKEKLIEVSKTGVFNIYGYIIDNNNNRYDCIKLIKKAN